MTLTLLSRFPTWRQLAVALQHPQALHSHEWPLARLLPPAQGGPKSLAVAARKAVFRSHGSDLLIFGEASADPIRTRGYAARRSADRCAAQAQGMSSSRREAGQRLTSFVRTSAK